MENNEEIKYLIDQYDISLYPGDKLKVPSWVSKSAIAKIKENKIDILEFLKNPPEPDHKEEQNKEEKEPTTVRIQKNKVWGWAIFYPPEWMDVQPRWESGDPVTLLDETIKELKLTEKDFTIKRKGEWPWVEVEINTIKETSQGKELFETWQKQNEKREKDRQETEDRQKIKENEIKTLQDKKLEEATKTGKDVFIRTVSGFDGDEEYPGQEMGWVQVNEYATPDGKIITRENPTY